MGTSSQGAGGRPWMEMQWGNISGEGGSGWTGLRGFLPEPGQVMALTAGGRWG